MFIIYIDVLKEIYLTNRDFILNSFYDRLLKNNEFNQIIHTHSSVERSKVTFDKHFISLFDDDLDNDYVIKRCQIAYTHARIGVLPNWMIAAYTLINQLIRPLIVKGLYKKQDKLIDVLLAYESLVTIDQQIIVETFNDSFQIQRRRLDEIVLATRHQSNATNTIT